MPTLSPKIGWNCMCHNSNNGDLTKKVKWFVQCNVTAGARQSGVPIPMLMCTGCKTLGELTSLKPRMETVRLPTLQEYCGLKW